MKAMFAAHGIALHVMPPAGGIPEHQVTTLDPNAQPSCAGTDFVTMQQLRAQYFGNLRPAYHYMVFAHDSTTPHDGTRVASCPIDALCHSFPAAGATGYSDILGNDSIVSFGAYVDSGTQIGIEVWAGTMMHELGHNFGLVHGSLADPGDAAQACMIKKPNYISVMNYSYQVAGITPNGTPGRPLKGISCKTDVDCGPPKITEGKCAAANSCFCTDDGGSGNNFCYRPDYAEDNLLNLNEATLNENVGVGGPPDLDDIVWYWHAGSALPGLSNGSPIYWDGNGTIENLSTCIHSLPPGSGANGNCPDVNDNGTNADRMDTTADWTQSNGRFIHFNFQFQCTAANQNDAPGFSGPLLRQSVMAAASTPGESGELSFESARQNHMLHPRRFVSISISPGCSSEVKAVAAGRPGSVRVAVLGTDDFDVSQIEVSSLDLHGAKAVGTFTQDVNGDGKPDLVSIFDSSAIGIRPQATVARLTGWLEDGRGFIGEDKIRVVNNLALVESGCR